MDTFFFLVSFACLGIFAYGIFKGNEANKQVQSLAVQSDNLVKTIEGFRASSATKFVTGIELAGFIYVDQTSKRLCVVSKNLTYKLFKPKDIIDVSIAENNSVIEETKITNQIGRAVVGGVLLGGVGAIIGGLTSNKSNSVNVDSLHVVMHLNDFEHHTIMLNCLPIKTQRNSPAYQNAINVANSWYGVLNVLMHSA